MGMWRRAHKALHGAGLILTMGLIALGVLPAAALAEADLGCVPGEPPASGPYDYRVPPPDILNVVEKFHFIPQMEALVRGATSTAVGPDLAYVFRYFPNHHRALATLIRLAKRDKTHKPVGMSRSVECYFDLALRMAPNDGVVHLLYGVWLVESGDKKGAEVQLVAAQGAVPLDNANAQYNLGLGWFALGRYDEALTAAHAAYGMGYPLPGLRQKLEKVGKWQPAPQKAATSPESRAGDDKAEPAEPAEQGRGAQ